MHPHEALVREFYARFAARDAEGMAACYHPDVAFSDPVFPMLRGEEAGDMWRMLLARAADLLEAEGIATRLVSMPCMDNFATQATGVVPRSPSAYISLASGTTTTYTVSFATPGGVAVVSAVDTGALDAGAVYSVYLFGNSATAQARLVRDR